MNINKESIIAFAKKYKYIIAASAAAVAVLILIIALASGGGNENEASEPVEWGEGITEGIPEFEGTLTSRAGGEGYAAFYYENVTSEQVGGYTSLIETECNTSFSSDKYPRTAKYGEKTIIIHYNVTEMKMSVTVTESLSQESSNEDK